TTVPLVRAKLGYGFCFLFHKIYGHDTPCVWGQRLLVTRLRRPDWASQTTSSSAMRTGRFDHQS
ncbi:MAG: hypothetical protein VX785_04280, partial [Actinomycetota bacterium]|nr:hypothetical protein [Actinomycetota bacterium]